MWEEIMKTENGKEFSDWLYKTNRINPYNKNTGFTMDSAYGYEYSVIKENIINNLSIEWLDSKEICLTIGHYKNIHEIASFYYKINDFCPDWEVKGCSGFDTRQEAIQAGIKKAFELLENK